MTGTLQRSCAIAILAASILAPARVTAQGGWQKQHSGKGVTVWSRDVEGSPNVETKAVATIAGTTDEVWEYLTDEKNVKKLIPTIVDYRVLGSCGTSCTYVYQRIHRPPIKDRHWVIEVRWSVSETDGLRTYRRWTKGTKAKSPPVSGPVLVENLSGSWVLKPTDCGASTRMTRISHLEIGGNVPPAVFNAGAVKNTLKFMLRLRNAF